MHHNKKKCAFSKSKTLSGLPRSRVYDYGEDYVVSINPVLWSFRLFLYLVVCQCSLAHQMETGLGGSLRTARRQVVVPVKFFARVAYMKRPGYTPSHQLV